MANEYLTRTPTSTGNRKVWTLALWLKRNIVAGDTGADVIFNAANTAANSHGTDIRFRKDNTGSTGWNFYDYNANAFTWGHYGSVERRDSGNWFHAMFVFDSTKSTSSDRVRVYINGILDNNYQSSPGIDPSKNYETYVNSITAHYLGVDQFAGSLTISYSKSQFADVFLVDGQALTPDVFGFYKQGKGYISAGSTQATDFRPGQWVPKTPRVIKTEINRRGGFGVNGFYLPMNDSKNFGADFHCDPNSIITLNEKLPQPRVGVATTASVGLGYTDALRADPYAANLVLALPFVSGGLSSGFGDYSAAIKGSGSAKTMSSGSVSIASTASYYGTSANYQNANSYVDTPGTSGDFNMGTGDFTVEGWFYPIANSGNARLFGQNTNTYNAWDVYISGSSSSGQLWMMGGAYQLTSASIQGNQWNHVAISRKNLVWTTYINGVAAGIVTSIVNNTVGDSTNKFRVGQIGENAYGGVGYGFQGYIQDFRVYKGVAKYTGGFDVPRPYTPVGIATWRAVPDTTANNFATLNPLAERQAEKGTITTGNLRYDGTLNQRPEITSTIGVSTGKWYYEVYTGTVGAGGDSHFLGICNRSANSNGTTITIPTANVTGTRPTVGIANRFSTQLALYDQDNTYDISGTSGWWVDGSVVGFAFDINNNSVSVYKNGVLGFTSTVSLSYVATGIGTTIGQGAWSPWLSFESSASRTPASNWVMNFGQNPTFSGNTTAGTFTDSNGKGLFKYQPPSGFLALCEDNLPTPAISDPGKYFKTVLWTGDGNNGRSIVGVGFTPDLIWYKPRNVTGYHGIVDSVRGAGIQIYPNDTLAEAAGFYQSSFDSNGFGVNYNASGSTNNSGSTYVAWCWRAGAGTTSTNTNGSITSVVSVNQDAGFSIVSYTGNGGSSAVTVGHGLGKVPSLIICKGRQFASNWITWHKSLNGGNVGDYYLRLNATDAQSNAGSSAWNNTAPTSTTFTVGASSNTNGPSPMIAYCWAEIEGFSKFGSYVGNGNADGPMVYTGGKPAFLMIKRTDTTNDWVIKDSSRNSINPTNLDLYANTTDIEVLFNQIDFLSNGFKIRNTNASTNASGGTYIFACWMESPFTTANAK